MKFVRSMGQIISSETHVHQRNRRAYEKKKKKKERNNSLPTECETVHELFIFEECD